MVWEKCQKYRRERRCSKDGWPKHKNERKRPIHSKFWPKPLWLSMVLDWGLIAQISRNLEKILSFVNFLCNLQVFPINGSNPPRPFIMATPFDQNSAFPDFSWKFTYAHPLPRDFVKFWASRKSKNKQKMTFCHIFETQKAVWGDCNFGVENDHQIQKFQLGWKVDSENFPTSLLLPNLDTWKCPKISLKGARPIRQFSQNFTVQLRKTQIWPCLTFWSGLLSSLM